MWAWKYGFDKNEDQIKAKTYRNNWVIYELTTLRGIPVPDMYQDSLRYQALVSTRGTKNTLGQYARKHYGPNSKWNEFGFWHGRDFIDLESTHTDERQRRTMFLDSHHIVFKQVQLSEAGWHVAGPGYNKGEISYDPTDARQHITHLSNLIRSMEIYCPRQHHVNLQLQDIPDHLFESALLRILLCSLTRDD